MGRCGADHEGGQASPILAQPSQTPLLSCMCRISQNAYPSAPQTSFLPALAVPLGPIWGSFGNCAIEGKFAGSSPDTSTQEYAVAVDGTPQQQRYLLFPEHATWPS